MVLKDYYWFFKSAIPVKVCQQIIDTALEKQQQVGVTGVQAKKLREKKILEKSI